MTTRTRCTFLQPRWTRGAWTRWEGRIASRIACACVGVLAASLGSCGSLPPVTPLHSARPPPASAATPSSCPPTTWRWTGRCASSARACSASTSASYPHMSSRRPPFPSSNPRLSKHTTSRLPDSFLSFSSPRTRCSMVYPFMPRRRLLAGSPWRARCWWFARVWPFILFRLAAFTCIVSIGAFLSARIGRFIAISTPGIAGALFACSLLFSFLRWFVIIWINLTIFSS